MAVSISVMLKWKKILGFLIYNKWKKSNDPKHEEETTQTPWQVVDRMGTMASNVRNP